MRDRDHEYASYNLDHLGKNEEITKLEFQQHSQRSRTRGSRAEDQWESASVRSLEELTRRHAPGNVDPLPHRASSRERFSTLDGLLTDAAVRQYGPAMAQFGIDSVEDLLDASLVSDNDLVVEVGM